MLRLEPGAAKTQGGPGAEPVLKLLTVNGEDRVRGSNNHGRREKM